MLLSAATPSIHSPPACASPSLGAVQYKIGSQKLVFVHPMRLTPVPWLAALSAKDPLQIQHSALLGFISFRLSSLSIIQNRPTSWSPHPNTDPHDHQHFLPYSQSMVPPAGLLSCNLPSPLVLLFFPNLFSIILLTPCMTSRSCPSSREPTWSSCLLPLHDAVKLPYSRHESTVQSGVL